MKTLYLFAIIALSSLCLSSCDQVWSYTYGFSDEYKLGETMTFVPQLSENSANVDSIEYYLDKKHIATYTEMPFVLQYKLTDYKVGDYILEYTIFYTDKKYTPPFTYTITITTNISIY